MMGFGWHIDIGGLTELKVWAQAGRIRWVCIVLG